MKFSQLVAPTLREDPAEAEIVSHKLLLRAGFIRKLTAGIYSYLPLGHRVLSNVITIIREELDRGGAQEILMPALQPAELWQETGRWGIYGKELFRVKDRHEHDFCLGPTHEEVITDLVRNSIKSYKNLPVTLYQIQTKFRDEIRPRFGLMRGKEFMMKDAYSFHTSEESLDQEYKKMEATYRRIFDRMGLKYVVTDAEAGLIGGNYSQEFNVVADSGENELPDGKRGIEVGHIFKLGKKYSEAMKCVFIDENNQEQPMFMGCYGIGVSRTLQAAVEQSHDKDGIIWSLSLAPFKIAIVPVNAEEPEQMKVAEDLYQWTVDPDVGIGASSGLWTVLLDDRPGRLGGRLKDVDLMGIPVKIIIGPKGLLEGKVEVKLRRSGETVMVAKDQVSNWLKENLK